MLMAKPSRKGTKSEAEIATEAKRKKEILEKVAQSDLPTKTILKELGISRSTYYSWLKRYEEEGEDGLLDSRSLPKAEEEVKEVSPAVEEKEPEVADVEVIMEVEEESPPDPEEELIKEMEARTPYTEPPAMKPDTPVAAPVREESEEKQEVVMPKETVAFAGGEKKKGIGIYAFIAILLLILGLLFSVSLSHHNTYELRETGNTLTLWRGKFAARGFEMVESFEPLQVGDSDVSALTGRTYAGKDDLNRAVYAFLMSDINAEIAKGNEANNGKIALLMARAEDIVGTDVKGGRGLADIRYQLAEKRVAIAEMDLKKAYEKALPVYQEAARMGLADAAMLAAKIVAMQETLQGAPMEEAAAVAAQEAEPESATETAGEKDVTPTAEDKPEEGVVTPATEEEPVEEAVTSAAPEEPAEEAEVSTAVATTSEEAGSAEPPAEAPEVSPTEQEESSGAVGQEEEPNKSTSFMDWLKSEDKK